MASKLKHNRASVFRKHFETYIEVTELSRRQAEKRRDYRDLKQWTPEEAAKITGRGQAPIVFDQFSKKVDGIIGLEVQRRTDPKAMPVHPGQEKCADVITDGLRYVESSTHLDEIFTDAFEDKIVEGIGGCIIEVERKGKSEYIIKPSIIPWDRIYYDPHSRDKNFKDAAYIGVTLWMDVTDAIQLNESKADEIKALVTSSQAADDTFEDRPRHWIDSERDRVRINQEFFLDGGIWHEVWYSGDLIIREPRPSQYLDEEGQPVCPIELESDFIDRENQRWGYMQRLIDVQDEINHRRSKALYMLSSVSIIAEKGALGEIPRERALRELTKAQGFLELNNAQGVQILRNQEMGSAQLGFYQDAQNAMDSVGINPELTGGTNNAISGRAFIARQQGGMTELARIMANHSNFKKRVYTQIWWRMRQFWTKEKWIRVTNNSDSYKFVGINIPVTVADKLIEQQTKKEIYQLIAENGVEKVDAVRQSLISQDPRMAEVVETRNDIKKAYLDIVIEDVPDTAILQQEQFDTIANLAASRADPLMFEALVKLSSINGKEEVLKMFKPDEEAATAQMQAQAQAQQAAAQLEMMNRQAGIEKTQAETQKILSEIPLNQAKTAEQKASAIEKVDRASRLN